jgi:hypothetical protein
MKIFATAMLCMAINSSEHNSDQFSEEAFEAAYRAKNNITRDLRGQPLQNSNEYHGTSQGPQNETER